MNTQPPSFYQRVIDKTKGLAFQSQFIAQNIDKKKAALYPGTVSKAEFVGANVIVCLSVFRLPSPRRSDGFQRQHKTVPFCHIHVYMSVHFHYCWDEIIQVYQLFEDLRLIQPIS